MPVFFDGLLIVYLGTYHVTHKSILEQQTDLFSETSYELVDKLRSGLDLSEEEDGTQFKEETRHRGVIRLHCPKSS
jgi:hypothetical protein